MWIEKIYQHDQITVLFSQYTTHFIKAPDQHEIARDKVMEQFASNDHLLQWISFGNNEYVVFVASKEAIRTIYEGLATHKTRIRVLPYGLALWSWCLSRKLLSDEFVVVVDQQATTTLITILSKNYISPTRNIENIRPDQLKTELIRTVKFYQSQLKVDIAEDIQIYDNEKLAHQSPAQQAVEFIKFNINFKDPVLVAQEQRYELAQRMAIKAGVWALAIVIIIGSWAYPLWANYLTHTKIIQLEKQIKILKVQIDQRQEELLLPIKNQLSFNLPQFMRKVVWNYPLDFEMKSWTIDIADNGQMLKKVELVKRDGFNANFNPNYWQGMIKEWEVRDDNGRVTVVLTFD